MLRCIILIVFCYKFYFKDYIMLEDWKELEKWFLCLLYKFYIIGNLKLDLEVNYKDEWNEKSLYRKYGVFF